MTEARHPNEAQALSLVGSERFAEWLDAIAALASGWPHSRTTARWWLEYQCGVESLGQLATDPLAAARLHEIARRFELWDRNEELAV